VNDYSASALFLGGDIAEAPTLVEWLTFLADRVDPSIYFVLGNHDYYGSSIEKVRQQIRKLDDPRLNWLPRVGVVDVMDGLTLVGHGGWGDARLGNFHESSVLLTDYVAIEELVGAFDLDTFHGDLRNQKDLKEVLGRLGDDAASTLQPILGHAVSNSRQVLVLTHVPPFKEACWHGEQISDDEWLPGFTCKAMGDLLRDTAAANPGADITVLCGHTHGTGVAEILPNLRVYTGEAAYGSVGFRVVEFADGKVTISRS